MDIWELLQRINQTTQAERKLSFVISIIYMQLCEESAYITTKHDPKRSNER